MHHSKILIVDDQVEVLEVYQDVLHRHFEHEVECASLPAEAVRYTRDELFDMVIIDAKIPYKSAALGGLLLAEELSQVVGMHSILLMSQYDVRGEVSHFNPSFTFMPKPQHGHQLVTWVERELLTKIQSLMQRQYGFVIMPFGDDPCNTWYRTVLIPWMREAGYELRRMDEIATTKAINTELLEKIRQAHFAVVCMPDQNANVYFEAGFATALNKFILLFASQPEAMPFDIRANHIFPIASAEDEKSHQLFLRFMAGLRGVRN